MIENTLQQLCIHPNVLFPKMPFILDIPDMLHPREIRGATASTTPKEEVKDASNGANLETGVDKCRTGDSPWCYLKSQILWFNHIQSIGSIRWTKIVKEHSSWKKLEGFPIVSFVFSFFWEYVTSLQLNSKSQSPICVRDFHAFWTRMDLSLPTFLDYRLLLPITLSAPWLNRCGQGCEPKSLPCYCRVNTWCN